MKIRSVIALPHPTIQMNFQISKTSGVLSEINKIWDFLTMKICMDKDHSYLIVSNSKMINQFRVKRVATVIIYMMKKTVPTFIRN